MTWEATLTMTWTRRRGQGGSGHHRSEHECEADITGTRIGFYGVPDGVDDCVRDDVLHLTQRPLDGALQAPTRLSLLNATVFRCATAVLTLV